MYHIYLLSTIVPFAKVITFTFPDRTFKTSTNLIKTPTPGRSNLALRINIHEKLSRKQTPANETSARLIRENYDAIGENFRHSPRSAAPLSSVNDSDVPALGRMRPLKILLIFINKTAGAVGRIDQNP